MRRAIQVYVVLNMLVIGGTLWFALTGHALYRNVGVSLAPGWYMCRPYDIAQPLQTGTLLELDPPAQEREVVARLAPHEPPTRYWMKQLMAQAGDTVCLEQDHVTLNGTFLAFRPLLKDYPLVRLDGCWTLGPDAVFVGGTHAKSFDSRYFGPWNRATIHGTCRALWTWGATP